ncbi:MAG TPA: class D sortase [Candidatus Dormibacteraeota bacterium]|nr:class D sortase [Candidatus Dormibacteraeota bacterium]
MHARRALFRRVLTLVWVTCLVTGLVLMANFGYGMWKGVAEQQHLNQVWTHQLAAPRPEVKAIDPSLKRPVDGVDFAIRIPKLGYYAAIREGVDSGVLYASPGHYPDTRWPGDPGTVGVAAHNVYWIDFPQLVKGDEIDLETRYGTYRYRVVDTEIVNPDNRTALVTDSNGYHLTLTTCWPLWAGAFATQRYIIHTDQFWPTTERPGYT